MVVARRCIKRSEDQKSDKRVNRGGLKYGVKSNLRSADMRLQSVRDEKGNRRTLRLCC